VNSRVRDVTTWTAIALVVVGIALGEIRGGELLLLAIIVLLLFPYQIVDFIKETTRR